MMNMANERDDIPQGGTHGVGESSTEPSGSVCPSYSGGDNICHHQTDELNGLKKDDQMHSKLKKKSKRIGDKQLDQESSLSCSVESLGSDPKTSAFLVPEPTEFWRNDSNKRSRDVMSSDDKMQRPKVAKLLSNVIGKRPSSTSRGRRGRLVRSGTPRHSEDSETDGSYVSFVSQQRDVSACEEDMDVQPCPRTTLTSDVGDASTNLSETLERTAFRDIEVVLETTSKSKNLKGTSKRAIKEAAERLRTAVEGLATRSATEETRRLQLVNEKLVEELGSLRKEVEALRKEFHSKQPQTTLSQPSQKSQRLQPANVLGPEVSVTDDIVRAVIMQVGKIIDARFAGIEDRLMPEKSLRPPLASDVNISHANGDRMTQQVMFRQMVSLEPSQASAVLQKRNTKSQQAQSQSVMATQASVLIPSNSTPPEEAWQTVTRRKRRKNKAREET
uniref:Uncharacterized protein n=1 Tax=Heliothis virescens TaxID=7102 RepID=A0A2A4K164_HELVI